MIIGMNNERMELNNNNTTTHLSQNTVNEIEYFRLLIQAPTGFEF